MFDQVSALIIHYGSRDVIDKVNTTFKEKYNGRGFASEIINNRIKHTTNEKYGVDNAMQSKVISYQSSTNKKKNYYGDDKFELLSDVKTLYEQYFKDENKTLTMFAEEVGMRRGTLSKLFRDNNLDIIAKYSGKRSSGEIELEQILNKILPNCEIIKNTRKIISPYEIDLWLPEYNLGIEYHGSYWHKFESIGDKHHIKAKMALDYNITLIQIFDFELVNNYNHVVDEIEKTIFNRFNHLNLKKDKYIIDSLYPSDALYLLKNGYELNEHKSSEFLSYEIKNAGHFILNKMK